MHSILAYIQIYTYNVMNKIRHTIWNTELDTKNYTPIFGHTIRHVNLDTHKKHTQLYTQNYAEKIRQTNKTDNQKHI